VLHGIWIVWWLSWSAAALWSDRAAVRPARQTQVGYRLLVAAGVVLLFGLYRHDVHRELVLWSIPPGLTWAMVALAALGLSFCWWARLHLGRLWSASVGRKADHRVIDTGPYAIVRHPIYTGILTAASATAALRGTGLAWLGVALMTAGWVIKAHMEERFLREQLGAAAYDDYARRVPMLSPLRLRRRSG
jgi:protein-S-isoprenylcysteine O-methyltransferase Ste14